MTKFKFLTSIFVLMALAQTPSQSQEREDDLDSQWPEIQETQVTMGFDYNAERFDLMLPIFAKFDDEILYVLTCYGGSQEHTDYISNITGNNYVGPFLCVLNTSDSVNIDWSLLSERDGDSPWHTRGRFGRGVFFESKCFNYPEFGRTRHFRLRGFELTLKISEPELDNENLNDFALTVKMRRDSSVTSEWAEPSGFQNPYRLGRSCDQVLTGEEPTLIGGASLEDETVGPVKANGRRFESLNMTIDNTGYFLDFTPSLYDLKDQLPGCAQSTRIYIPENIDGEFEQVVLRAVQESRDNGKWLALTIDGGLCEVRQDSAGQKIYYLKLLGLEVE